MKQCIAIGGNVQLDGPIITEFFRRSGSGDGHIVILPTASARNEGGIEFQRRFCDLGLQKTALILPVRDRAAALQAQNVDLLRAATGIFFIGGDQLRLATVLAGTPVLSAILERYQQGVVVAGTSAGAAVMGKLMIIRGRSGSAARSGSAHFAEGFGFIEQVLIDQHFHQKNRLGRLLYTITIHPGWLGVGIDENTAAVFEDDQLTVLGKNSVTIIDGQSIQESNIDQVNAGELFSVSDLRLTQLTTGSQYFLKRRAALVQREPYDTDPT